MWMKGWFFEHFKRMAAPILPADASPDCNVGWWCHAVDWPEIWSAAGDWVAIAPQHWLRVRHNTADVVDLKSADELPADLLKNRACMVAMVSAKAMYAEKRCAELWSTTVGRSREFAHLCGRFVRIKQIGHSNVLYRGHARNSTPTSCNDAPARGLAHPLFLLLASPAWGQRAGGPRAVMAAKNQPFVRFQEP